jgi:hypothetical protein
MQILDIPPARCERLAGPLLVALFATAAGFSPVVESWRWILAVSVLLIGALTLWRHWYRRPDGVEVTSAGSLVFRYPNQRRAVVASIWPGIVSENLLVFRYRLENGTRGNLVVSAMVLSPQDHWVLRRAILAIAASSKRSGQRRLGR